MEKLRFMGLVLILVLGIKSVEAQQHYKGVNALEFGVGRNIFGNQDGHLNLSISKYKSRTVYLKGGLNYLENSFSYIKTMPGTDLAPGEETEICSTSKNYYADVVYFKSLFSNRSFIYLNGGIGAFMGVETYRKESRETQFLIGPKVDLETELFFTSRIALIGRLSQYWNPLSDIEHWNTLWDVGIKYLIY